MKPWTLILLDLLQGCEWRDNWSSRKVVITKAVAANASWREQGEIAPCISQEAGGETESFCQRNTHATTQFIAHTQCNTLPVRQSMSPFRWADCKEASMPPSMIRENPEVATSGAAYGEKWWCSVYYTAASRLDTELENSVFRLFPYLRHWMLYIWILVWILGVCGEICVFRVSSTSWILCTLEVRLHEWNWPPELFAQMHNTFYTCGLSACYCCISENVFMGAEKLIESTTEFSDR